MSFTPMRSSGFDQAGWRGEDRWSSGSGQGRGILPVHFAWVLSTSMSIVTSRYLLETLNWHYPFHLLSLQLLCSVIANIGLLGRTSDDEETISPEVGRLRQILSDVAFSISMPLFVQAIFHTLNIPTLCMLLPLAFLPSLIISLGDSNARFLPCLVRLAIFICGAAVLIGDDYRLNILTTALATPAILLSGIQSIFDPRECGNAMREPSRSLQKTAMSLVVSLILCYKFESARFGFSPFLEMDTLEWTAPMALFSNLVFSMVAFCLGRDIISPLPIDNYAAFNMDNDNKRLPLALSMAVTGITAASVLLVGPETSISGIQLTGYLAIVIVMLNPDCLKLAQAIPTTGSTLKFICSNLSHRTGLNSSGKYAVLPTAEETEIMDILDGHGRLNEELHDTDQGTGSALSRTLSSGIMLLITFICWLIILQTSYLNSSPSSESSLPILDTSYVSDTGLDIVISMYQEPLDTVEYAISTITSIPSIAARRPRIHIYTKSEFGIDENLFSLTTNLTYLPNIGREGETYLHHIISNWDTLATQTIFLQAELHNPSEISTRLQNFFGEDTGMLSLGFSGHTCDCGSCSDGYGWHDTSGILEQTYAQANNATCDRLLLSYKGQFAASARRIRGVRKSVYEGLQKAFADESGWAHSEAYLQGRKDSMDRPFFGYTLERLWSGLLQCSEERIARDCPSLVGGWRRGGGRADCQCFDEV